MQIVYVAKVWSKAGRIMYKTTAAHETREAAAKDAFTAMPKARECTTSRAKLEGIGDNAYIIDGGFDTRPHDRADIMPPDLPKAHRSSGAAAKAKKPAKKPAAPKKAKKPSKNEIVKEIQTILRDKPAPLPKPKFATREQWLEAVAKKMAPWFAKDGKTLPPIRVSIGFTSMGGKGKRIGECWTTKAAADGAAHIFIVPTLQDSTRIAGILAHELIHAAIGIEAGHGPKFKAMMKVIGLEGKATATTEGELFKTNFKPILEKLGPIPHVMLNGKSNRPKKQATRMIKCECPKCGYTARTTQKWVDKAGKPVCPDHLVVMK